MQQDEIKLSILQAAWNRARGRCECTQAGHGHAGRCNRQLYWGLRGSHQEGGWFPDMRHGGMANLAGVTILCAECKQKGRSVGF